MIDLILSALLGRGGRGGCCGNLNFVLCLSSSLVNPRLLTKNQLCIMPGSALTVCVGGWWLTANLVIDFGLALA